MVEMECASIMAVAESRNIDAYQFLYTEDTLYGKEWDIRELANDRTAFLEKCLEIALEIAKEI